MPALAARRAIFLGFAYFLAVITGLAAARPDPALVDLLLSWLVAFSLVLACATDARILGKPIPPMIQFIMLLTWPVAVSICLIWLRGWRGALWLLLFGGTLLLTYDASFLFAASLARTNAA